MTNTNKAAVSRAMKKAGLSVSSSNMSSIVRGWCSGIHAGVDYSSLYPWKIRTTCKGRYTYHFVEEIYQKMTISWTNGTYAYESDKAMSTDIANEKIKKALAVAGIEYVVENGNIIVYIENPYGDTGKNRNERERRLISKHYTSY